MNCKGLLFCIFVAGEVHAQHLKLKHYDSCYTPAGGPGHCINIRNCPELVSILQRRPLTSDDAAYLRSAICGFEGVDSKVCCSLDEHEFKPSTVEEKAPSTSSHQWREHLVAKDYDSCDTPAGDPGRCIDLRYCPELETILQRRPLARDSVTYLQRAHCGFKDLNPKVCCSLKDKESITRDKQGTLNDYTNYKVLQPMSSLLPDKYDCGQSSAEKIFGGEVADMFDFPWIALIKYKTLDGYGFHCGGSLINTRYVLTAAHCLIGKDLPEAVSVRLGEYNLELDLDCTSTPEYPMCADKHIDIPIAEMVVHEHYRPFDDNQYNDIALLRLARDIPYTDFIKPVCLPIYPNLINEYFVGTNATTAGWGRTETQRSGSSIKMKVTLPVRSNLDCKDVYASRRVSLSTQQLCVGGESGKDSCKGDSGGPLMHLYTAPGEINWYIIGIVSFGPQICGLNGWPSVYTRVTEYVPWILQHLRP